MSTLRVTCWVSDCLSCHPGPCGSHSGPGSHRQCSVSSPDQVLQNPTHPLLSQVTKDMLITQVCDSTNQAEATSSTKFPQCLGVLCGLHPQEGVNVPCNIQLPVHELSALQKNAAAALRALASSFCRPLLHVVHHGQLQQHLQGTSQQWMFSSSMLLQVST